MFFPESFWPPIKKKEYLDRIRDGYIHSLSNKILFCGITRNSNIAFNNISQLICCLKGSKMIVYENDAESSSLKSLSKVISNDQLVYKYENLGHEILKQDKSLLRRTRMAFYRNKVLEMAKEEKENFNYLAVADLDLLGGYSVEGILSSLSYLQENDYMILGSNGLIYENNKKLYYDSWAFRKDSWEEGKDEDLNLLNFRRGEDLVEVNSCFGGLCIYPISVLNTVASYHSYDCDHVTFHKDLKSLGYSVYLNPDQITLYSESYYRNYV